MLISYVYITNGIIILNSSEEMDLQETIKQLHTDITGKNNTLLLPESVN